MTYDEITLVLKALEHYENCGIGDDLEDEFKVNMMAIMLGNDAKQTAKQAQEIADNLRNTINTRKERVVLLRAKLIGMKDKALADEL